MIGCVSFIFVVVQSDVAKPGQESEAMRKLENIRIGKVDRIKKITVAQATDIADLSIRDVHYKYILKRGKTAPWTQIFQNYLRPIPTEDSTNIASCSE
jgi:hypothetical protein